MCKSKRLWPISLLSLLIVVLLILARNTAFIRIGLPEFRLVQSQTTIPVLPDELSRIFWGAVIAGVILALVVQLVLNLLGLAAGMTQLDPYDQDAPSAKALTSTAAVWVGLSMIYLAGDWWLGCGSLCRDTG